MSEQPTYKAGDKVSVDLGSNILGTPILKNGVVVEMLSGYAVVKINDTDYACAFPDITLVEAAPAPHADYPGGADQYREDVALLAAVGDMTNGEYEDGSLFYSQEIRLNATDTAFALSRFMPYALARLGGA